jgi:hypothetical protein
VCRQVVLQVRVPLGAHLGGHGQVPRDRRVQRGAVGGERVVGLGGGERGGRRGEQRARQRKRCRRPGSHDHVLGGPRACAADRVGFKFLGRRPPTGPFRSSRQSVRGAWPMRRSSTVAADQTNNRLPAQRSGRLRGPIAAAIGVEPALWAAAALLLASALAPLAIREVRTMPGG